MIVPHKKEKGDNMKYKVHRIEVNSNNMQENLE
jgi:hypothetical protein